MSNIRPYVIINGVDSRTIQGLLITSLPPISKPAQRTLTETIDGRDGDSSVKLGYSAYDKSLGIALTFGYNVDDVISFFNSEGTIVFSNEPDKLYNFEIFEAIDFEKLIRFKTATVTIHTQPFKFSTTENPLEFTEKEFTVVNNGNTDSRPNLVITGEGLATMQINGKNALNIDFGDAEQTLLIDSEGMNAYHTNNIKSIEAEIVPKQDLHGFDSPFIDSDKVNKVPYLSRALAGTAERIGNYEYNKLVGGTVAFNQLLKNGNFEDTSNWAQSGSTLSVNNNTGLMTATTVNGNISQKFNAVSGHKYLVKANIKLTTETNQVRLNTYMALPPYDSVNKFAEATTNEQKLTLIISPTNSTEYYCRIVDERASNWDIIQVKNFNLIDLTQMLGATIADYIYSLEQAQAGAGVAYFKALGFNKDYYPYNAGELMSVKTSAHVTKNAGGAVIQTVALDPNLELRGIPKLDSNNKLYYDGDTYSADGSVSRRFTKLVFNGSENWQLYETESINQLYVMLDNIKSSAQGITTVCAKYKPISINDRANNYNTCYTGAGSVSFNVAGYTVESWKSFLSTNNIEIICELATPTSESAEPFNNPIAIDANGSEEFTDSRAVAIPVGHESYYANICDIEGFTEVNLVRAGVNLFNKADVTQGKLINGLGNEVSYANWNISDYTPVKAGQGYYLYGLTLHPNTLQDNFELFDENKNKLGYANVNINNYPYVIPYGVFYIKFSVHDNDLDTAQLALVNNAPYSAYAGEIFKAEFEQEGEPVTVYGGKYNFTTGLLEITRAYIKGGFEQYNASNGYKAYRRYNCPKSKTTYSGGISNIINEFGSFNSDNMTKNIIQLPDLTFGTCYMALYADANPNDVEIVYEINEHIFIELDEQVISALLGINNFYADTGDVTVIFVNDGQDETQTGAIVSFDLDESDLNKGDLANRLVSGNYANIRLKTGSNAIKFIGSVSAVGLDKYSRWL